MTDCLRAINRMISGSFTLSGKLKMTFDLVFYIFVHLHVACCKLLKK